MNDAHTPDTAVLHLKVSIKIILKIGTMLLINLKSSSINYVILIN